MAPGQGNNFAQRLEKAAPDNWKKMLHQQSERKQRSYITISELKTEVYAMKQALQSMETPVSVLLLQKPHSPDIENKALNNTIDNQLKKLTREVILTDW
ncbi:hypothetical protein M977_00187 [Buttiauxella gaviniae ATCC 51604]|uniref:ImpA C-terminal domain-containing protein n=2 Tax=Buttiauxella gaviniae TaxID=82990 RepID=A0A1B7I634_9ENTR|nr:hypothetical protein M977_00187 [Buttiauxella gaviniae ATCC 51604]